MTIRTLSTLLLDLKAGFDGQDDISVGTLLEGFHERGFGFLLFVIALPAALPLPGMGVNLIIAFPLILLTAQQALGFHTIWLPDRIKCKDFKKAALDSIIDKALPWVERTETLLHPRLGFMTQGLSSNLVGLAGLLMALAILVPLPLTNTVPAMGIALMAVGILMRDGLAVLAGAFVGLTWITLLVSVTVFLGAQGIDVLKETIKSLF